MFGQCLAWCMARPNSLFSNKASLSYACPETKIILWSRQGGSLKCENSKHKYRAENQSLVNSLSLNFLVHCAEINNSYARIISFSSLISTHLFSRLVKKYFICTFSKLVLHVFDCLFSSTLLYRGILTNLKHQDPLMLFKFYFIYLFSLFSKRILLILFLFFLHQNFYHYCTF